LAFNFSIAQNRFDARQLILVREADAIGTAYLRCSVLGEDNRRTCRDTFRRYAELRVAAYDAYKLGDERLVREKLKQGEDTQDELWHLVARAVREDPSLPKTFLMDALNKVIDLDADRRASIRIAVPEAVSVAIVFVCLAWGALLGHSAGKRHALPIVPWIVLSLLISVVFGVALDFDRPRSGVITTAAAEGAMYNLIRSMETPSGD
jgi:hypothetical protein